MLATCLVAVLMLSACGRIRLASPDGNVSAEVFSYHYSDFTRNPGWGMNIKVDGRQFLQVLDLGLDISFADATRPFTLYCLDTVLRSREVDTIWRLPWGERKEVREHYNEMVVAMADIDNDDRVDIRIRVFDDGVAFRYEYHLGTGTDGCDSSRLLLGDKTRYRFPSDGICWSIPANFESYEFAYREQPLSQTDDANTPFTFRLGDGRYGAIHEANLRDMPEMTLVRDTASRGGNTDSNKQERPCFKTWLAPSADSTIQYAYRLEGRCLVTSWRTISVGRKAVDLINNDMILCLNEPCVLPHPEQYRPMKYVGVWWGMHLGINSWVPDSRHGATTDNAMRYIDFAAANDIDAVLFEGWNQGWEQWGGTQVFDFTHAAPDFDIDSVLTHARRKGVEVIIHHETGGNIPNYEAQMEEAYAWCRDRGVHAVKTGYAGGFPNREIHHSRYGVQHYARAMQTAARYGLALDVHEPIKPTGLRRTYPNLMSGEGARGMEWNAWSDGNPPSHQVTLPFTRLLAGPMDYTPGIFDITYKSLEGNPDCKQWNQKDAHECRVHTTLAKQVSLWVILYSPLVMAADLIENYEGHPMFQFFRDFNPDYDWSEALQGEPGQYIVVVRRTGSTYYLAAATNEEPRDITVPLSFLSREGRGQHFAATLYTDGPDADYRSNPTSYSITQQEVTSRTKLKLHLAPGGGCAVILRPMETE